MSIHAVLIVQFAAETFVIDNSGEVTVCLKTNTGNAVELNIDVILFMELELNGNTTSKTVFYIVVGLCYVILHLCKPYMYSVPPATDTVTFQPSSSDGIECTSFLGLMNVTDDDVLIVVFDLPPNSDAQKGLMNESIVVIFEEEDGEGTIVC